jgi:hypothetical protein
MSRRALACLLALPLLAQEPPKPTPHHTALKAAEGTWDAVVKMHLGPGKPPAESKGVEVNTVGLGGFWLVSEFKGEMMGAPFEGRGLFGYDPAKRKHVGTWVDSMSTWQAVTTGACKDGCREVTSTFQGPGMDGKPTTYREVSRQVDADHRTMAMQLKGPDGTWVPMMEIAYTRRK